MSFESIRELLETVCFYHTVNITQTFSKEDQPLFSVVCLKNTSTLEVKNLQTETVEQFTSVDQAASAIEREIGSYHIA
ncbi:hypothetical protein [Planococcus sp. YIM B11945]|uniref:hypothetical protein n=1 Tax=Planococcus sp. YIM B11945 TaxID=3435410 RepID=UPI003D7C5E70